MDNKKNRQDLEMGEYTSNKPINHQENTYGISKEEIDKVYEDYKNHLRESEFEKLKALGGSKGLLEKLKADEKTGLCNLDKNHRLSRVKEFDDNINIEKPMTTCCEYVWESLKDTMIRILIVASVIQIILGVIPGVAEDPSKEWVEGFSIVVAVLVVVSVGSITNWTKERSFRKLNEKTESDLQVTIVRDGVTVNKHPDDIIVGDVIKIKYGDMMKVDGIILDAASLEFDESPLTGESIKKMKVTYQSFVNQYEKDFETKKIKLDKLSSCLIYSGSRCCKGEGKMLCLRVGKNSEKGKIQAIVLASQESGDSKSPLEEKLDKMAGDVGKFGLIASVITFVALIIRFGVSYNSSKIEYDRYIETQAQINATIAAGSNTTQITVNQEVVNPSTTVGNKILKIFLLCIAIVVVAIPEGLPLAVTLSLAFAIAKMQSENNLVRFMTSCETMGTANYICSDKTGTLTTGKMTVTRFYTADFKKPDLDKLSNAFSGKQKYHDLIIQSIALNIEVKIITMPNGQQEVSANSSDKSFYEFLEQKLDKKYLNYEKEFLSDETKKKLLPFDSEKKCMSTLIKNPKIVAEGWRVFHKGGGDEILKKINFIYNPQTDKVEPLTPSQKEDISLTLKDFAAESLRNFIFAYKDISDEVYEQFNENKINIEKEDNFIFIGAAGIKDPLKEGVGEAVLKCNTAGIKVIMVTGDNIDTAISISKECNILNKDQLKEVRDTLETVEKKANIEINRVMENNRQAIKENDKSAVYENIKDVKKINQEEIYAKHLREYPNRKFLAIEGKELSERVGLICLTCGKTMNDRFVHDEKKIIEPKNLDVVMKLTNEKGHENSKKCYCLPNKEVAKKFFRDFFNRDMRQEDEENFVKTEALGNKSEFEKIMKDLCVISRAKPEDKYLLVFGLRQYLHVVAVTGDGTNDAPALSKADVGFSMGIAGTDVAKDASDIILLDDNFCSIVNAVKWGRNIYDCIRKFIQFQLTVNVTACVLVFITACIGNETPLNAIQMLWINLIMDSMGSLALATEQPNEKVLVRKPYRRTEYPISVIMWKHIILQSTVQLAVLLLLYLHAPEFIIENEPSRIAEADLIYLCFGDYPGSAPLDGQYFVLDGSENAWSVKFLRRVGYGENECGPYGQKTNMNDSLSLFKSNNGNSSHMTIIFNTFVLYTLFNQLNSRVLDDSFNIFKDIHKNKWFLTIEFMEFGLHAFIIQIAQGVFKVSRFGLTGSQWGVCIGFGALTFPASFLIKLIPDKWFSCFKCLNEKDENESEQSVPIEHVSLQLNHKMNDNEALYIHNDIRRSLSKEKQVSNIKVLSKSNNMLKQLSRKTSNMVNPNHKS